VFGAGSLSFLIAAWLGCPYFGNAGYYVEPVVSAHVDRNSRAYIQSAIEAGNRDGFWIASRPVEYVNVANDGTPMHRITQRVPYHRFPVTFPWSPNFWVEPLSDAHAIVLQQQTCTLYELYDAKFEGNTLSAYSGARWLLNRPFEPLPPGTPSAMASGLSLYAGMIRWEEVAAGRIDHALNWGAPAGTVAQYQFVRPASDTDGIAFKGASRYQLPYGARLRLHASFDTSRFGPQSSVIAQAMKKYGIYLADTGRTNELYNAIAIDRVNRWNDADLEALASIRISDFDVIELGPILTVPGH
jgi:hypothetical protein